jgi:hypothetical protein
MHVEAKSKHRVATVKQMAAMKFVAVPKLRAMTKEERWACAKDIFVNLRPGAEITGEILSYTKEELVAKVASDQEFWSEMLTFMSDTKDDADALQEMITSAYARLLVAGAGVVKGAPAQS